MDKATAARAIKKLEDFYKEIGLPTRLSNLNIPHDRFEEMAEKAVKRGSIKKVNSKDIIKILKLAK